MIISDNMTRSEKQVARFLNELNIDWKYEYPIFLYDEDDRPRVWTPDLGTYVEVCGSPDFDYDYRRKIYDKNDSKIIFLHYYKDPEKWQNYFVIELSKLMLARLMFVANIAKKAKELGLDPKIKNIEGFLKYL